jgi:hypothetical protein
MDIERTQFGQIVIDGRDFPYDVVVQRSGAVVKRTKRLSKAIYGTSHILSEDEARAIHEPGVEVVILGTGQYGRLTLSPEAERFFANQGCAVEARPTPEAIILFNQEHRPRVGLFHVTC